MGHSQLYHPDHRRRREFSSIRRVAGDRISTIMLNPQVLSGFGAVSQLHSVHVPLSTLVLPRVAHERIGSGIWSS